MISSELLHNGLTLMLFGMGFVFVFLTVLVLITRIMSWVVTQYEQTAGMLPEDGIPSPTAVIQKAEKLPTSTTDIAILPILSAAIQQYRQHRS